MQELTVASTKVNLSVFKDDKVMSDTDKTKVREYAKLTKLQENLHKEIEKVSKLMSFLNAKWCKDYLWINQQGEVIPLFDIDDEYLKNIYNWSIKNDRRVSKPLMQEYITRFGIPESIPNTDSKYKSKKDFNSHSVFRKEYDEDDYDF